MCKLSNKRPEVVKKSHDETVLGDAPTTGGCQGLPTIVSFKFRRVLDYLFLTYMMDLILLSGFLKHKSRGTHEQNVTYLLKDDRVP